MYQDDYEAPDEEVSALLDYAALAAREKEQQYARRS